MRMPRWLDFGVDTDRYEESTLDLMKRKATEAGLDPTFFDELAAMPDEPGSLGPSDPGRLGTGPRWCDPRLRRRWWQR